MKDGNFNLFFEGNSEDLVALELGFAVACFCHLPGSHNCLLNIFDI